jgi:hypothetical protein
MSDYDAYVRVVKFQNLITDFELSFKSNPAYQVILEHTHQYAAINYLESIKKEFRELYNNNKSLLILLCEMNDKYGKPQKFPISDFCVCSPSNLRYIYHSLVILSNIKKNNLFEVDLVEIGGGYGGLSFFIHNLSKLFNIKIKSYTIFDLKEITTLQKRYLKIHNISVNTYHIDDNWELNPNSYLISNYAFSEISKELQIQYTNKVLNKYIDYGFLVWNFIPIYNFIENKKITVEDERPFDDNRNKFVYITPA